LEKYLEPWDAVGDLVEYRDNPVLRKYIALANLVDALPTWLEDLFIPLFIPHSTLVIPVNDVIPLKIPIGNFTIPLPAHFTIKTVTMTDMNKFKTLKPTKLIPGTKFTWGGHISMHQTTIIVETELVVLGKTVTATFTLPLAILTCNIASLRLSTERAFVMFGVKSWRVRNRAHSGLCLWMRPQEFLG
jgi:hypothetical protein